MTDEPITQPGIESPPGDGNHTPQDFGTSDAPATAEEISASPVTDDQADDTKGTPEDEVTIVDEQPDAVTPVAPQVPAADGRRTWGPYLKYAEVSTSRGVFGLKPGEVLDFIVDENGNKQPRRKNLATGAVTVG